MAGRSTRMRERAQQSWPALPNTAAGAAAAAAARSASAKTRLADLPPSSSVTRLMVPAAPCMIPRPTSVEPVKAILATPGCSTSRRPTTRPGPASTLTTPGGMPASVARSEGERGQRGQLGRLEHDGVAGGQGRGQLPGGDGEREVPGHDQPHHPQRLPEGQVDPAGHRDGVAEQPLGGAGVVGEGVGHHAHLAPGVGDRLAGVAHLQLGQALAFGVEAFGQAAQQPAPVRGGDGPPALERGRRPGHGRVGVVRGGRLQPLDHRLGGRVADLEQPRPGRRVAHSRSKPRNRSQSVTTAS